jgi:hypothetical protein
MTIVEKLKKLTWLRAIEEAAKEQLIALPPFIKQAMGVVRSETLPNSRFVTLKRRLVPISEAVHDGMEWTLWRTENDLPAADVSFRLPLQPEQESVSIVLRILKGWLIDDWALNETESAVNDLAGTGIKGTTSSSVEANGICKENDKD